MGQYDESDLAWATKAGYTPIDVRFSGSAYLVLQGILLGTVVLNDKQMAALELRARLEKLGLREDEAKPEVEESLREDALAALKDLPSSTLFSVLRPKDK
jgi:hypothetical protein